MAEKIVVITEKSKALFHNNVDYCIGTGRMGLALTKEYQEQLKLVQEEIGFKHIRGHGLFCDDMAIYQEYEENGEKKTEYNFTYLDRVMDSYRNMGLRPFLELGFMPKKLAKGEQTVFYWEGNVTPPKDYDKWCRMVQALLRHLMERYGVEEAVQWPIEVWNEPNLSIFWEHADMQEYFKLFHLTFDAVKEVDERFCVGGPAVCGGSDEKWIRAFMEYCHHHKIAVDFITRHHYTIEQPETVGHYDYSVLMEPEDGFANLQTSRDIIDSFSEYRNLPIHITEFNTSYTPKGVIHDTNLNAAFIAHQLSRLGDVNESYSYWTFGDVFEEQGVPFTPFHGGFGLVAEGCIPKPTFWTFAFYKKLKDSNGQCVYKDDNMVVLKRGENDYLGIAWNIVRRIGERLPKENEEVKNISISMPACDGGYSLCLKIVDEETCNPLKVWHDLGEPACLSEEQKKLLREAAMPFVRTDRVEAVDGNVRITLNLHQNAVVYFEVNRSEVIPDRGYDYERVKAGEHKRDYRNVFAENGISQKQIEKRLEEIKHTFFYQEGERLYYPVGEDMAYITDTGNNDVRTESMSYGMMLSVQLDMKEEFDRLWKWAKTYMWMDTGENEGYFAWSCALDGNKNANGAAPDGEEFFAMALFFASHRWGDGEGIFNYSTEARAILKACLHKGENGRAGSPMWNRENHQILFVAGIDFTDPSYHLPHFYELFALWAEEEDRAFWKQAAAASREYLAKACHPVTGFCAEYAEFDGTPMSRKLPYSKERHDWFYSDSYRTVANIGLDYEWFGADCGQIAAARHIQEFLIEDARKGTYHIYEVDGRIAGSTALHPIAITATIAQASLATDNAYTKEWVERFFRQPLRTGERRYYDNCLYFFAFLALSGNYRIW